MREAKYPRKAILTISDGDDNHSRYTEGETKLAVREADVVIHTIGIFDRYFRSLRRYGTKNVLAQNCLVRSRK